MAENRRIDEKTGTLTVGHEWDGIEELDTPMPRWWLWTFYATVFFALVYIVLYPALPMLTRATAGTLGWTSQGQLEKELAEDRARRAPLLSAIANTPVERIADDPRLLAAATEGGRAAFKVNCSQCHGSGAAGGKGYPNLADDDWLWGGDPAAIQQTITHGVRFAGDDQTRTSQMPAFGRDGILKPEEIDDLVSFVRVASRQETASASSRRGSALFQTNCAVCHGPAATGNRSLGAPNLTDPIWLYGGDRPSLTQTIGNARYGVMPAWHRQLDAVTIKMLTVYIHSLGGGERAPASAPAPAPAPAAKEAGGHVQPR
jgi:cytochrome c oxidase cbb3-type subunit 3